MPRTESASSNAFPITYSQRFVYEMMQTMGPRAPLLQLDTCVRISGPIDVSRLEQAATILVKRHPILCSRLDFSDGRLVQRETGPAPSFEVVEIADGADQVDSVLSARADEPLDLFQENPFRVVLARTHPGEAFLMMLAHHMVLDATGMKVLLDEYLELCLDRPADAGETPWSDEGSSYYSFARHERRMIQDGTFDRRARYWLDYLDQADPTLHLPQRGADPGRASFSSIPFTLDRESFHVFSCHARRLGVSQFALAAAAIFQSLRAVTTQDDLLLQVVTDTRRRPFGQTIGQFADRFVLRQRGQRGGLSDKAIRSVYRETLLAMRNQISLPHFAQELNWLADRSSKQYSMTEAYVNYLSTVADTARFSAVADFEISPFFLTARARPSNIPYYGVLLHWEILPRTDSLSGSIQYESALVEPAIAETVATTWLDSLARLS